MSKYALLFLCTFIMSPEGFFGFVSSPRSLTYQVESLWDIRETQFGSLEIRYISPENPPASREGMVVFRPDDWVGYSCSGCTESYEGGNCE